METIDSILMGTAWKLDRPVKKVRLNFTTSIPLKVAIRTLELITVVHKILSFTFISSSCPFVVKAGSNKNLTGNTVPCSGSQTIVNLVLG